MKFGKEFRIGFFAVAVMTASFFLINYLRGEDIFNKEIEVSAIFPTVDGLVPSAPVYIKGYKAGKVSEVNYDVVAGNFEVVCSMSKDFIVPSDSKMTIYSVDIMGGKGIKIDLGSSRSHVVDGGQLSPAFEAGLMDGLSAGMPALLDKVSVTIDSLCVAVSGINRLLAEENQANIARTLEHLENTMSGVSKVASVLDGKSGELDFFLSNLSNLSDKLNGIADKTGSAIDGITSKVDALSESDIEEIVSSLNQLLKNINDPDGTIGKLFVDNSIYDSVDALLSDIDSLVNKIQENPKKYIRLSVF